MTVSVIVPNYNHAPYLRRRIDSILAQTMDDFELIILDDASTDESRAVITEYASDPRVRIEINAANSGNPFVQWRKGIDLAAHDYIWIAESDDVAEPAFLATMVSALDRHPAASMAVCESDVIDQHDVVLRALDTCYPSSSAVERWMDGAYYCRAYMYPWNSIPNASAVLFHRTAFAQAGVPATDQRLCGDWMSYARILMTAGIVRVPDRLNHFREHATSVRRRTAATAFVREGLAVQRYLRAALDMDHDASRAEIVRFFGQALVAAERRLPSGKVPIGRAAGVLRDAASFGPRMLATVGGILLREGLAALAGRSHRAR